ncbi:hypothetical protein HanIR_Chr05g0220711 [Helianthus annuus]|nr:hypothetical protein HanIR_Chr05g0220711 [Helianthus annuus]
MAANITATSTAGYYPAKIRSVSTFVPFTQTTTNSSSLPLKGFEKPIMKVVWSWLEPSRARTSFKPKQSFSTY